MPSTKTPVAKPAPYQRGSAFKACAKCPSPAKCKAAGQCAMKAKGK